jgi:sugar O-acyltransferase (sialic acid O-acetyltransferase NeuD family)
VKLLIYGASDFGAILKDLIVRCGHEFVGFVDDAPALASTTLGTFREVVTHYDPQYFGMVIAVGYNDLAVRWRVFRQVRTSGYPLPPLIHPEAYVHDTTAVAEGATIMARAIVDLRSRIGEASVLWPGANVSHDTVVGPNCFLSPNCAICGFVILGHSCFIGAGAVVPDHRSVPDQTWIKAGKVWNQENANLVSHPRSQI